MKKFVKIMLAALLAVIAVTCFACTDDVKESDKAGLHYKKFSGDDYYTVYGYVDDGKTTVLDVAEYVKDENIVIGRIKAKSFDGNSSLTEIIVPDTVKEIDAGAFAGMKSLKKITLPFIGANANADAFDHETESSADKAVDGERNFGYIFGTEEYDDGAAISQSCGSGDATTYYIPRMLGEVTVKPAADYKIPMYAFNGCSNLHSVTLGDKVTDIGESAFENCSNLKTVNFPATVNNIYKKAFANSAITSITLNGVEKIGAYAFNDCKKLETVNVTFSTETGVEKEIGSCAFMGCEKADVTALASDSTVIKGANWNKDTKNA